MSPAGDEHADIEVELGARLRQYGKESKRGRTVGGEVGIFIRRNPDTVRGADIAFISTERDAHPKAKGFFEVAPELVVEILSPEDRPGKINPPYSPRGQKSPQDRLQVLDFSVG